MKLKNLLYLFILIISISLFTSCFSSENITGTELKEFQNIIFNDDTIKYDGLDHSLEVKNYPNDTIITYSNNNHHEVGSYCVKVTLEKEGYVSLELSAYLNIIENEFEGLVFNNQSFDYDGLVHSLSVNNISSDATVIYTNNDKTLPGNYVVKATVKQKGYKEVTLSAIMTIKALEFENITFIDQKVKYNGEKQYIYVSGLPSFAKVSYSNNGNINAGTYKVTATITADGYRTLTLSANLIISDLKEFENIVWTDRLLIFNGTLQTINYDGNLPRNTNITYYLNDKEVDKISVKEIGDYKISIKLECDKYETIIVDANLMLRENTFGSVDNNKTAYKITNNTTYNELYNEIMKGNFSATAIVGDDYYYPDGTTKSTLFKVFEYYVTENEYFEYSYMMNPTDNSYDLEESECIYIKVINDYALIAKYKEGKLYSYYKIPSFAYKETVMGFIGMIPFVRLGYDSNNKFVNGVYGGYRNTYSTYSISEKNNSLDIESRLHYYHSEFNHDEVEYWSFYNIGNTLINPSEFFNIPTENVSEYEYDSFNYCGIEYIPNYDKTMLVYVDYDLYDIAYLNNGEFILLPVIEDYIVSIAEYNYYYSSILKYVLSEEYQSFIKKDDDAPLSKFTLKLYINEEGDYQGEYSNNGYLKNSAYLRRVLVAYGMNIKYYSEWN